MKKYVLLIGCHTRTDYGNVLCCKFQAISKRKTPKDWHVDGATRWDSLVVVVFLPLSDVLFMKMSDSINRHLLCYRADIL